MNIGFKSIVVDQIKLDEVSKEIKKSHIEDLSVICKIDYPEGASSVDVRGYSVLSAKEKGASIVEVFAPKYLYKAKDFKRIHEDLVSLINLCKKNHIEFRYCISSSKNEYLSDDIKTKIARIFSAVDLGMLSINVDQKSEISDEIIKLRFFKSKIQSKIKTILKEPTKEDLSSFVKAGVDVLGLDLWKAPFLIHAYEGMISNK